MYVYYTYTHGTYSSCDSWYASNVLGLHDLFILALLGESKPKYVISDLRSDTVTHWNLILPQIRLY